VNVELQVIDGTGRRRFRVKPYERLWPVFRRALIDVSALPDSASTDGGALHHDIELSPPQVRATIPTIESELRDQMRSAVAQQKDISRRRDLGIGREVVAVLGTRLWLDQRLSEDLDLVRLNDLFGLLTEIGRSDLGIHVFAVPDLPEISFQLAWMVRSHPDGVARQELRELLSRRFRELHETTSVEESRARYHEYAHQVHDDDVVVAEAVSYLVTWGLATVVADGTVNPTEKLQLIVL